MQNMGKIESHPSVTICPFIDQCDRPGVPKKIVVKLIGAENDIQSSKEGTYIIGPKLVNGEAYWIQDGPNALWFNKEYRWWCIGNIKYLGSIKSSICKFVADPLEANTWRYCSENEDNWIEAGTDFEISPGIS